MSRYRRLEMTARCADKFCFLPPAGGKRSRPTGGRKEKTTVKHQFKETTLMKTCVIEPSYGKDEYGNRILEYYTAWDTTTAVSGEDDVIEQYTPNSKMDLIVKDLEAQGYSVETRQELKKRIEIAGEVLLDRIAEAHADQAKLRLAISDAAQLVESRWGRMFSSAQLAEYYVR